MLYNTLWGNNNTNTNKKHNTVEWYNTISNDECFYEKP